MTAAADFEDGQPNFSFYYNLRIKKNSKKGEPRNTRERIISSKDKKRSEKE